MYTCFNFLCDRIFVKFFLMLEIELKITNPLYMMFAIISALLTYLAYRTTEKYFSIKLTLEKKDEK